MKFCCLAVAVLLAFAGRAWALPEPAQSLPPPSDMSETSQTIEEPDEGDMPDVTPVPEKEPVPAPKEKPKKEKEEKPTDNGDTNFNEVVLQGLNKVTARASTIEAPIGNVVRFGTIEIVAHSCWKAAPEEQPENAALLEISEIKQGEAPQRIFLGWMFSSSPGLSALQHPFYDVTVIECKKVKN